MCICGEIVRLAPVVPRAAHQIQNGPRSPPARCVPERVCPRILAPGEIAIASVSCCFFQSTRSSIGFVIAANSWVVRCRSLGN
jgi:hypothetical protein